MLTSDYFTVFIMDNFSAHRHAEVICTLKRKGLIPFFLPPNSTALLQPLDLSLNKIIKTSMKRRQLQWQLDELNSKGTLDDIDNPTRQEVCEWARDAVKSVDPEQIKRAFRKPGWTRARAVQRHVSSDLGVAGFETDSADEDYSPSEHSDAEESLTSDQELASDDDH